MPLSQIVAMRCAKMSQLLRIEVREVRAVHVIRKFMLKGFINLTIEAALLDHRPARRSDCTQEAEEQGGLSTHEPPEVLLPHISATYNPRDVM